MTLQSDEIMIAYASALSKLQAEPSTDTQWHKAELIQNTVDELDLGSPPIYTEQVLFANAADASKDELKILREKHRAVEPEDMVEKAHPKTIVILDSNGDGGVLENLNEQHQKIMGIINKMPNGNVADTYASSVLSQLVKIATDLDDAGHFDEAVEVDIVIASIHNQLKKKAIFWMIPVGIGLAVLGLGAGAAALIRGVQEGLVQDCKDLQDNMEGFFGGWIDDEEYQPVKPSIDAMVAAVHQMVQTGSTLLTAMSAAAANKDEAAARQANELAQTFGTALATAESSLILIKQQVPGKTGMDFYRTTGLLNAIKKDFSALQSVAPGLARQNPNAQPHLPGEQEAGNPDGAKPAARRQVEEVPDSTRISQNQKFLNQYFYQNSATKLPITGKLDDETQKALTEFSEAMRTRLGSDKPTPYQLESANEKQLRLMIQLYRNPTVNPIDGSKIVVQPA